MRVVAWDWRLSPPSPRLTADGSRRPTPAGGAAVHRDPALPCGRRATGPGLTLTFFSACSRVPLALAGFDRRARRLPTAISLPICRRHSPGRKPRTRGPDLYMFYLRYIWSELRRRRGRTIFTALGLGVGVGLVVTVSALSSGLDQAQSKVLEPLTGVGTDMSVTRPIQVSGSGDNQSFAPAGPGPAALRQGAARVAPRERRRRDSTSTSSAIPASTSRRRPS